MGRVGVQHWSIGQVGSRVGSEKSVVCFSCVLEFFFQLKLCNSYCILDHQGAGTVESNMEKSTRKRADAQATTSVQSLI